MSKIVDELRSKYSGTTDEPVRFISFPSHRSRERGIVHLSDRQSYYSFKRPNHGIYRTTTAEIEELKKHRNIHFSILRPPYDDLGRCSRNVSLTTPISIGVTSSRTPMPSKVKLKSY